MAKLEYYKNYFSIKDIVESEYYKYLGSNDFFTVNILNPSVLFRNIRNYYYMNLGYTSEIEKAFKKREKITRKNSLNNEDVAVYLVHVSGSIPKP